MTINGVQGGLGNMSPGGWSFKCMSRGGGGGGGGGVRRHNRNLSRGVEQHRSLSRGWGKTETRPGGIYKSVPGGVEV